MFPFLPHTRCVWKLLSNQLGGKASTMLQTSSLSETHQHVADFLWWPSPPSLALTLLMTAVRDTEQDTGTLVPTHKVPPPRSTCFLFLCCEFYRWRYGVVKIYINPLIYPPYIAWAKQKDVTGKNKNTFAVQKLFL